MLLLVLGLRRAWAKKLWVDPGAAHLRSLLIRIKKRRKTLLLEMQRRNKVGGIVDRRFGENDPTMAPEDKMLERFTQEKQRRHKNSSAFDLEDDDEAGELTHMGQSLSLDGPTLQDDLNEDGFALSDAEDHPSDAESKSHKRRRHSQSEGSENGYSNVQGQPERKKTKQEVMKEVIAKSKLYKYERQAAKEQDDDMREEMDKEMAEIHALLRGGAPRPTIQRPLDITGMNPERAALLAGADKLKFDKEYDLRLRQLAQDKKSKPMERTKTEEEKLAEDSRRLQELEAQRLRRMRGEPEEDDDDDKEDRSKDRIDEDLDEDEDFGLGAGITAREPHAELGVEDEDDFIIDDDLVASGSDVDSSDDEASSEEEEGADDADADFLDGLLTEEEAKRPEFLTGANGTLQEEALPASNGVNGNLAYTFPCPQSHDELLEITKNVAVQDLPIVVRRIRALYHPQLKSENKAKLGRFTIALIGHISYLADQSPLPPFDVLETLIRHIHSLAKTFPVETANAFRVHLAEQHQSRALAPTLGDLTLLGAIGTLFPTSDHFHQVVTPAMLCMARFIGQKIPQKLSEYVTGTYLSTLCLQYQRLSKRFIPEIVGFLLNNLCALSPARPERIPGSFAYHESKLPRLEDAHDVQVRKLSISDIKDRELSPEGDIALKLALIEASIKLLDAAAETWIGKSAFREVFDPVLEILRHLGGKLCRGKLPGSIQVRTLSRI